MDSLLSYLIRMLLVSGLLTGYYMLALRDKRMHGFNRVYLLVSVALALVLPVLRIGWNPWLGSRDEVVQRVFVAAAPAVRASGSVAGLLIRIGIGICVLSSVALLGVSILRIIRLYRLRRKSHCRQMEGYKLIETDAPGTPFSFLRNLFWRNGADLEDVVNRKMLAHELAHIRGRHSWDILGMQLVLCIFWMNPFFWVIRRELTMVLEYTADAASGAEGDPEGFARMLLQAFNGGLCPDMATGFFHSPIKRRLTMITNNNRPRRHWVRMALAVPVAAAAVLFFACTKQESAKTPPLPPPVPDHQIRRVNLTLDQLDAVKIDRDAAEKKFLSSEKFKIISLKLGVKNGERMKMFQDSVSRIYVIGTK